MVNIIQRTINDWFSRLLDAANDRNFADQDERHAKNRTKKDYIFNSLGLTIWGMAFPLLTVVVTQFVGVEKAGMFSLAFVVALLLSFIASFGVRTFQVSDIKEEYTFSDYQINRLLTSILTLVVGAIYCLVRGYDPEMFIITISVIFYRMIDGFADVYEGRLQQMSKLYLAGISQVIRSILVLAIFTLSLLITHNLVFSSIAMAVTSLATLILLTIPLTLFETPKSKKSSLAGVVSLFKYCFPLFLALFLFNLIDSMPRFVMEGVLSYDNQLYFNALYFPAQAIVIVIQFVYKPQLVRFANLWDDRSRRKRFDLMILAVLGVILVVTILLLVFMATLGLPLMSFLYGFDFEQFRSLSLTMILAGGIIAAIDFLYQMITVLRQQHQAILPYLITLVFALFIPLLLVKFFGLSGNVYSYLIIMCILFILLIWQYLQIRRGFTLDSQNPFERHRRRFS